MDLKVKEPPLLTPPTQNERWWIPTEKDKGMISEETMRSGIDRLQYAKKSYFGKELGVNFGHSITPHEEKFIRIGLMHAIEQKHPESMANFFYYLERNGFGKDITDEDRQMISLAYDNGQVEEHRFPQFLLCIKGLNIIDKIKPEDVEKIQKQLTLARKTRSAGKIARIHYIMDELGLDSKLTDEDMGLIKETIRGFREGRVQGIFTELMFHTNKIMKDMGGPEGNPPLPPLKEGRG